ncbi:hypothetical protein [Flavobacterium sp.]|uniref:Rieske (2Fe-2S) protein n=1 Tax=Flavobacterium sp. TaxID=239 RepID=UPI00260E8779|nr:hypothetical protein [Flavobacterium sp.]
MKKTILLLAMTTFILGCSKDRFNNENPNLPNYNFSIDLNTSLPAYANLKFTGNAVKAFPANGPTRGVIVFNNGSGYNAFDGACPNQALTSCSNLNISGSNANCTCGNENYNLFTGQAAGQQYELKRYRVEVNGDVVRVFN